MVVRVGAPFLALVALFRLGKPFFRGDAFGFVVDKRVGLLTEFLRQAPEYLGEGGCVLMHMAHDEPERMQEAFPGASLEVLVEMNPRERIVLITF